MPQSVLFRLVVAILLFSPIVPFSAGRDWPQWRGPLLNGSTDDAAALPAAWDPAAGARWATALPGPGGSTPAVVGGRIYLTSIDRADRAKLHALALDRASGKILWTRTFPGDGRTMPYSYAASPSPVVAGGRIVFLFGNGVFVGTDPDGKILWRRQLEETVGPLTQTFIHSASPLLYRDRLYLPVLRNEVTTHSSFYDHVTSTGLKSLLLCIDPATGRDLWRMPRPSDDFTMESRDSYATPVPWESAPGQVSIVTVGGNFVTGQDPQTGAVLWKLRYGVPGGYRRRVVPTPVVAGELLVVCRPRAETVYAIRPGGGPGEWAWDKQVAWEYDSRYNTDTPSLLYYRDRLYMLKDKKGYLTCLDPATGKALWTGELGVKAIVSFASPTGADGKIFCVSLNGEVVVLEAGAAFKKLGLMNMGGNPTESTIVASDGELFIRTAEKIYCIK